MFYLFLFFFSRLVVSDSLQPHGLYSTRLHCPWDFPGKNTGVGCHFLLQRIFLTQGLNLGLLHYRQILYHWATSETLMFLLIRLITPHIPSCCAEYEYIHNLIWIQYKLYTLWVLTLEIFVTKISPVICNFPTQSCRIFFFFQNYLYLYSKKKFTCKDYLYFFSCLNSNDSTQYAGLPY